ncbi:DUF2779 domain-containing protein [Balneolaceae bacterium YR4-1]|uniref:DUF2779 domain-containing protein n=1 Tax=Halalkalibaculum roseum TaxID=2709311 RepID=A0A6M1STA9_9BACT|nr:DUF2779 domain-containing protein [Halalkalibaculum roseum]NGP76130.1 DUF2779 domain-containing protein [Halalkalibaculum roseum]
MPDKDTDRTYFTKHHFRTGLECPTRLYYNAREYPENREALPSIAHYRYNKKQLTALARCQFPKGLQIDSGSIERDFEETRKKLKKGNTVLFDPVFIHNRLLANIPILEKKGDKVNVYHIQTKTFRRQKSDLSNSAGEIYSKWRKYAIDFAFQIYVISRCYPGWEIRSFFLLPAKYALAKMDKLHEVIGKIQSGESSIRRSGIKKEEIIEPVEVTDEIGKILNDRDSLDSVIAKGRTFEEQLIEMAGYFFREEKYPVTIGNKCKNCEFRIERERVQKGESSGFVECWNESLDINLDNSFKPLVFNLIGPGTKHWVERGIYLQEQVPDGEFYTLDTISNVQGKFNEKQRQSLQIMQAKGNRGPEELVKPNLYRELNRWEFPIHFLDFEAGNYVIPIRKGRRPYHLLVFQYSCHSLTEEGHWNHYQWIDGADGTYPNYELVRSLKKIPDIEQGTIVQYSNFERNALRGIRKELLAEADQVKDAGELTEWILQIINRHDSSNPTGPYLSDLSRLVKNYYYNAEMEDSLSIKDVLQSIMSVSPQLKEIYSRPYNSENYNAAIWWQADPEGAAKSPYRLMLEDREDEGIRRGTEAMVVYAQMLSEDLTVEEKQSLHKALLRYCELDTLAMVMIYQHWHYLMEENWN